MNLEIFSSFFPTLKGILDVDINDPELLKKKVEAIKKFTEKIKDMKKPEEKNSSNNK